MIPNTKILVVGDFILDGYTLGIVDRVSPEAPVPVVNIKNTEYRLGGAANVANNISAISGNVGLLSTIGNDRYGDICYELIKNAGIKSHLIKSDKSNTIFKNRITAENQQMVRLDYENKVCENDNYKLIDEFIKIFNEYELVVFSDYGKGNLGKINNIIHICNEFGIPTLVDPKGKEIMKYECCSLLKINFNEIKQYVGEINTFEQILIKTIELKKRMKVKKMICTLSERGIYFIDENSEGILIETGNISVFDVSGAGDTILGVVSALYSSEIELIDVVQIANKAGSLVLKKFGTSIITKDEITKIIEKICM